MDVVDYPLHQYIYIVFKVCMK